MSIEEYEKLSEERPDLLKIIDGSIYYSFDYTDYLYRELEKKDNIINELENWLELLVKVDFEYTEYNKGVNETYQNVLYRLKELKENKDE